MNDLTKNLSKKEISAFKLPERCGVAGCVNPCDVYIKEKNISRCAKHYQEDVDKWGATHRRGSASGNILEMMDRNYSSYQSVKSGKHLTKILENLSQHGRKEA